MHCQPDPPGDIKSSAGIVVTAGGSGFACIPHRKETEAGLYAVHDGRSSPL